MLKGTFLSGSGSREALKTGIFVWVDLAHPQGLLTNVCCHSGRTMTSKSVFPNPFFREISFPYVLF